MQCDCRLLWLKNITHHTFGLLFRREFKHYKCVFTKELSDFKVEDEVKILELVKNEVFVNYCQPKSADQFEIEETLDVENVSPIQENKEEEKPITEEKANQLNVNESTSRSTTQMNANQIDSNTKQQIQKETHSTQPSTESFTRETEKVANDVNEDKKTINANKELSLVKASQERTKAKDSGHSLIDRNNRIVFSFAFIVYVFCKNQLIH